MVGHSCYCLDCLSNGVLLSALLLRVSAHQKKGIWRAIAKEVWTLAEHPLSQTMGGPETQGTDDCGGSAGDGLPMKKGCPLDPAPPDGPHTDGGLS
ncbi:hypothetical protein NDU88_004922 [Pleurodeles waltl]|uniref:Uncharacterized protein n=1 Tax=Pleurodeles waltl TaxID=8319 RepID=A0AAV7MBE2_PLEWA|nr:hypothetical protein NDU88_004922 [Pleurodeles waltl]